MDYVGQAIIRTQNAQGGQFLFAKPGAEYCTDCEPDYIMTFGGMADGDETPQQAMSRELREEIGLTAPFRTFFTGIIAGNDDTVTQARKDIITEISSEYDERLKRAKEQGFDQVVTVIEGERDFKIAQVTNALDNLYHPDNIELVNRALLLQSQFDTMMDRVDISMHMGDVPTLHVEEFVPNAEQEERGWYKVETHYYDLVLTESEYDLCKALVETKQALGLTYEIAGYADLSRDDVKDMTENPDGKFKFSGAVKALRKILNPGSPTDPSQMAHAGPSTRKLQL